MKRLIIALFGLLSYTLFLIVFLYLIGFLANFLVPRSVDQGVVTTPAMAVAVNLGLILLFGLPHSLMARGGFKRRWTQIVPPAAERSTYVLVSSLLLGLLMWQWRPITTAVWSVETPVLRLLLWSLYGLGYGVVLLSSFLINHFELFGLEQVYRRWRSQAMSAPTFRTPLLYRIVRHPLQFGLLMAFWITPEMSVGHLLFALGMTAYMLVGLTFEERDLVRQFGESYRRYQAETPMLLPIPLRTNVSGGPVTMLPPPKPPDLPPPAGKRQRTPEAGLGGQ